VQIGLVFAPVVSVIDIMGGIAGCRHVVVVMLTMMVEGEVWGGGGGGF
jgi:hypothetical protein